MKEVDETDPVLELQRLREELAACRKLVEEQRRQMTILEFATQALAYSLDPAQVLQTATSLAATLASPPGSGARRGVYYEILDDTMRIVADSDDTGSSAVGTWMPIVEHPLIPKALAAGEAIAGVLDPERSGPRARQIIARFGLKFAAYVPVRVKDKVHGVLVVSSRDKPIPAELVERLGGLGALTALALTNALRHRGAEVDAITDSLTGSPIGAGSSRPSIRSPIAGPLRCSRSTSTTSRSSTTASVMRRGIRCSSRSRTRWRVLPGKGRRWPGSAAMSSSC